MGMGGVLVVRATRRHLGVCASRAHYSDYAHYSNNIIIIILLYKYAAAQTDMCARWLVCVCVVCIRALANGHTQQTHHYLAQTRVCVAAC